MTIPWWLRKAIAQLMQVVMPHRCVVFLQYHSKGVKQCVDCGLEHSLKPANVKHQR
jgi:hypothetical protein